MIASVATESLQWVNLSIGLSTVIVVPFVIWATSRKAIGDVHRQGMEAWKGMYEQARQRHIEQEEQYAKTVSRLDGRVKILEGENTQVRSEYVELQRINVELQKELSSLRKELVRFRNKLDLVPDEGPNET